MPTYEMVLLYRQMLRVSKKEIKSIAKPINKQNINKVKIQY